MNPLSEKQKQEISLKYTSLGILGVQEYLFKILGRESDPNSAKTKVLLKYAANRLSAGYLIKFGSPVGVVIFTPVENLFHFEGFPLLAVLFSCLAIGFAITFVVLQKLFLFLLKRSITKSSHSSLI
jgi:hypothetical protein